jgi:hypothetical protein
VEYGEKNNCGARILTPNTAVLSEAKHPPAVVC